MNASCVAYNLLFYNYWNETQKAELNHSHQWGLEEFVHSIKCLKFVLFSIVFSRRKFITWFVAMEISLRKCSNETPMKCNLWRFSWWDDGYKKMVKEMNKKKNKRNEHVKSLCLWRTNKTAFFPTMMIAKTRALLASKRIRPYYLQWFLTSTYTLTYTHIYW